MPKVLNIKHGHQLWRGGLFKVDQVDKEEEVNFDKKRLATICNGPFSPMLSMDSLMCNGRGHEE